MAEEFGFFRWFSIFPFAHYNIFLATWFKEFIVAQLCIILEILLPELSGGESDKGFLSECPPILYFLLSQYRLQHLLCSVVIDLSRSCTGFPLRLCFLWLFLLDERELFQDGCIVDIHLLCSRLCLTLNHALHHGWFVPIEPDSDLDDTTFAFRFQTVNGKDILHIKGVSVWDVPRSIYARDADVGRTILNNSVSFHGWSRLDESAINFEFSVNNSNLVHSFSLIDFLISGLWLVPSGSGHVFGFLTLIEFSEWLGCIVAQECFKEVLGREANLAIEHLQVRLLHLNTLLECIKLTLRRVVWLHYHWWCCILLSCLSMWFISSLPQHFCSITRWFLTSCWFSAAVWALCSVNHHLLLLNRLLHLFLRL